MSISGLSNMAAIGCSTASGLKCPRNSLWNSRVHNWHFFQGKNANRKDNITKRGSSHRGGPQRQQQAHMRHFGIFHSKCFPLPLKVESYLQKQISFIWSNTDPSMTNHLILFSQFMLCHWKIAEVCSLTPSSPPSLPFPSPHPTTVQVWRPSHVSKSLGKTGGDLRVIKEALLSILSFPRTWLAGRPSFREGGREGFWTGRSLAHWLALVPALNLNLHFTALHCTCSFWSVCLYHGSVDSWTHYKRKKKTFGLLWRWRVLKGWVFLLLGSVLVVRMCF